MSEVYTDKCSACAAELRPNNRICAYCGKVNNLDGDYSVENMTIRMDYILKLVKETGVSGFFSSSNSNSKITMPILTIIAFMLAYKVNGWFGIIGIIFLIKSFLSLVTRSKNIEQALKPLKAQLDDTGGKFEALYGKDKKIKQQLEKYTKEWRSVELAVRKRRMVEWISFAVILALLILAFFLPEPKTASEIEKELAASEIELTFKGAELIKSNNLEEAGKLLFKLKSVQNITELKSKIQLKEIEQKLATIDSMISAGKTDNAASELVQIKWIKTSKDYDIEQFEESYFKQFIEKKAKVNSHLPAGKRVMVEEETDF